MVVEDDDVLLVEADAPGLTAVFSLTKGFNFLFLLGLLANGAANRSVAFTIPVVKVFANFLGLLSSSLDEPPSSASLLTIIPSSVRSPNTDLYNVKVNHQCLYIEMLRPRA